MLQIIPAPCPRVQRHSPRSESWIQYLATRKVTGESLARNAVNFLPSAAIWNPSPAELDPNAGSILCSPGVLYPCCSIGFPCASVHFVGTTPHSVVQLPISRTSYYLVNNSTSLTSFIINFFFFFEQKLKATYLGASSTQLQLNAGFFWAYCFSLSLRFWSFLARPYPKPHCLNPRFATPFPACLCSLQIPACLTDTSYGAAKEAAEFHSGSILLTLL